MPRPAERVLTDRCLFRSEAPLLRRRCHGRWRASSRARRSSVYSPPPHGSRDDLLRPRRAQRRPAARRRGQGGGRAGARARTRPGRSPTGRGSAIPELCAWLAERHGHGLTADRVMITNGSLEAGWMLFSHLLSPGDEVVVEQPSYDRTLLMLEKLGVDRIGVELEEDGINVDGPRAGARRRLSSRSSSTSSPTSTTRPAARSRRRSAGASSSSPPSTASGSSRTTPTARSASPAPSSCRRCWRWPRAPTPR